MSNIFFIGDTDFGHHKILEFEKEARPFKTIGEHDEALINNWNSVVGKRDVIYHLGDVIFSGSQQYKKILSRLQGIKQLILGNHDRMRQLLPYFNSMFGAHKFDGCSLTHIPIHPSQFYRFKYNIHGHLHSDNVKIQTQMYGRLGEYTLIENDRRYINVSAEQINLIPISYDDLKKRMS